MLQYLFTYLQLITQDEEGQDLAEYAILLAVIALVVIAAAILLGQNISTIFTSIGARLTSPLGS